ncbi:hypothetical protein P9272_29215, partial [Mesorhizobium sp. WSM4976]|uniref:hypothetical protein n=1 Tax=Mesorhizobium sp. WSM4976 TaxID=3038549 RepID=UPI002417374B
RRRQRLGGLVGEGCVVMFGDEENCHYFIPDFRLRGSLKSGQAEPKTVGFENRSGAYIRT